MTEIVKKDNRPAANGARPAGNNRTFTPRPAGARPANAGSRPTGAGQQGAKNSSDRGRRNSGPRDQRPAETEYDQKIIDLARVTRVMAGGKRMRFRACLAIGNRKGKVAIGLAKGVDVTAAITKAFNQAKKNLIEVPIANGTIPHQVEHKFKAAHIIIKPARVGSGIKCGSVIRVLSELAGIHNMTGKILGTNNNVANAKCAMEALAQLRKPKTIKKRIVKAEEAEVAAEAAVVAKPRVKKETTK